MRPGVATTYAKVVAGAARRGETALGFKRGFDVQVNLSKSTQLIIEEGDRVVVLADT